MKGKDGAKKKSTFLINKRAVLIYKRPSEIKAAPKTF